MGKAKRAYRLFAECPRDILHVSTPVSDEPTALNESMKTAVRPLRDAADMTMLHWVEMDVVEMAIEICLVSNGVLPIPALPNAFLALCELTLGTPFRFDPPGEVALDQAPAGRKVRVVFRQRPKRV